MSASLALDLKDHVYGIEAEATKKGMFAVHINGRSSDIEVDHVVVTGAGFGGFNVKDEPRLDGSTNRDAFEMVNIHLHHNLVRNVEGEGFYVGHSFYNGWKHPNGTTLYPHVLRNVRIAHNRTENTGCEGIQVGCSVDGLEVVDNVIIMPGQRPFGRWQDNGIQINCGGNALIARNRVLGAPGNALIVGILEHASSVHIARNEFSEIGGRALYVGGSNGDSGQLIVTQNSVLGTNSGGIRIGNEHSRTLPWPITRL